MLQWKRTSQAGKTPAHTRSDSPELMGARRIASSVSLIISGPMPILWKFTGKSAVKASAKCPPRVEICNPLSFEISSCDVLLKCRRSPQPHRRHEEVVKVAKIRRGKIYANIIERPLPCLLKNVPLQFENLKFGQMHCSNATCAALASLLRNDPPQII